MSYPCQVMTLNVGLFAYHISMSLEDPKWRRSLNHLLNYLLCSLVLHASVLFGWSCLNLALCSSIYRATAVVCCNTMKWARVCPGCLVVIVFFFMIPTLSSLLSCRDCGTPIGWFDSM